MITACTIRYMRIRWPWRRQQPTSAENLISISDPALVELFNLGPANYAGVEVGESSALGLSAVWRAVALISGTMGTLPLRTIRDTGDGMRQRMTSFLDNPGGPDGPTPFEWKETVMLHLLLHGNAFLRHIYGGAGQLLALEPIHPLCVSIDEDRRLPGGKLFKAYAQNAAIEHFDARTMTHIPAMCTDGLRGISPITNARNSLGTAIAGDRSAARQLSNGALIAGMVTPDEDVEPDEVKAIKAEIEAKVTGWENAGKIPVVNRKLKFTPWMMTAKDAQFLESRAFSVQEVARWFGVPATLLMDPTAVSTWGTGVEIQYRGLGKFNLGHWATRIEQRLSRLLPAPRFVEFDFARLERPTPEQEIDLLIKQTGGKPILSQNEARARLNLPPVEGGDELNPTPAPAEPSDADPKPEGVPA